MMKIKMDFVSNSSSTSFIYISSGEFSKSSFFDAVGISQDSPLFTLFENMYYVLSDAIRSGDKVIDESQLMQDDKYPKFTPEVIDRAKKALKEERDVVISSLHSDGILEECFLCMEIFEIESNEFYINAYDNYW